MTSISLRRKIGRVVRAPDGFEVGQSVNLVAISPRTWIRTLELVEEAERRVAALPEPPSSPWKAAMARVKSAAHAVGRRPRKAAKVEADSTTTDAEVLAFATIVYAEAPGDERARRGTMIHPIIMGIMGVCRGSLSALGTPEIKLDLRIFSCFRDAVVS
jgi:hypothetical protein